MKNDILEMVSASPQADFGDGVSDAWINSAENELGLKFPPSYIAFLRKFGIGELGGVEIFGIYQLPFDEIDSGGDIVVENRQRRKGNPENNSRLYISDDNGEELYYFDLTHPLPAGEYLIRRIDRIAGQDEEYAQDFLGFLQKRLAFLESA
jgi:hypothetical protein